MSHFDEWDFPSTEKWANVDKTQCEDFPGYVTTYWKVFQGATDDFLLDRRCNVTEPINFPVYHLDHWIDYNFLGSTLAVAVVLYFIREILDRFVFMPYAKKNVKDQDKIHSFCESCIKIVYYTCSWSYCLYVLWDEPLFWDHTKLMNLDRINNLFDFPFEWLFLYYLQMGWYLQCLVTHFTHDTAKEDSGVMLTHHAVTLSLIYCSYKVGYMEYGVLVLFSMDLCDVFLEVLRALRRIVDLSETLETIIFLPLPISWFLLRLWFYCRSILTHTLLMVPIVSGWQECMLYYPFNALLIALFCMNLYWFFLIMRIAYRQVILGKQLDDTREKPKGKKGGKKTKGNKGN